MTKLDTPEGAWLDKSGNSVSRWTKWNPLDFSIFLRHEGAWNTASCGRADWNAELLDAADELLRPDLDTLCDIGLTAFRTERLQTLSEALYDMEEVFKSNLDTNQFGAFHDFFDNIGKQRTETEVAIKEASNSLETNLQ